MKNYISGETHNDEKLPYFHKITKKKFLVSNINTGLSLSMRPKHVKKLLPNAGSQQNTDLAPHEKGKKLVYVQS